MFHNIIYFSLSTAFTVPPEITDEITDLLENETNPITFNCQVIGEPVPNISWYFNNIMVLVSNASKYNISTSINGTLAISLLTISSVQSNDVGTYNCHAKNILGIDISSGVLTVNGKNVCNVVCMMLYIHV